VAAAELAKVIFHKQRIKMINSTKDDQRYKEAQKAKTWYADAIKMAMENKSSALETHIQTYLDTHSNFTIVDILVEFKAEGRTLLHMAASSGHATVMSMLLGKVKKSEMKTIINLSDDKGFTPLIYATIAESTPITKMLLAEGADVTNSTKDGATAAHFAAGDGSVARLSTLVKAGARVNQMSRTGTPLHWAAAQGRADAIKFLVEYRSGNEFAEETNSRVDLNACCPSGSPAVIMAAVSGCDAGAETLVKAGADTGYIMPGNLTLLHICAENGLEKAVQAIIASEQGHSASANVKTNAPHENTPLELAAMSNSISIVTALFPVTDSCGKGKRYETAEAVLADGQRLLSQWTEQEKAFRAAQEAAKPKPTSGSGSQADVFMFKPSSRLVESTDPAATEDQRLEAHAIKNEGNNAFKNKEYAKAVELYSQAIRKHGSDEMYWSNRCACYLSLNLPADALLDAEVCRFLKPDWPKGCYRLGQARMACGMFEDAAVAAFEGMKLDNNNAELKKLTQEAVKRGKEDHQRKLQLAEEHATAK